MQSDKMDRRDVLQLAAAGVTSAWITSRAAAADEAFRQLPIVDTNISLFQWPFRRVPLDTTQALVGKLRSLGVAQAWAGSFEGLLHRDIAGANSRLARACDNHSELVPIGSINPTLPNWQEDLRRCIEVYDMPGVRVHPGYHRYTLNDPRFAELLDRAAAAERFVQVAVAVEDTRTQHPLVRVPDVDLSPLPTVKRRVPEATVQILNGRLRPSSVEQLSDVPGILFDTARVDGTDGVPSLVDSLPPGRVLYGSHAPLLVPEAALIRVHESGQLQDDALLGVLRDNALHALGTDAV